MTDPAVLIVGAGPTGLVLALWLTRLGVPVRIVDRAAEPGTTSRALAVQARTLELYGALGIADAVVAGGVQIVAINLWARGRRAARAPFRRLGEGLSPYPFALVFPQDAHERLLIERLASLGVTVERPVTLTGFEQDAGGVTAALAGPDGATETCRVAWLAGCDGASSTVREVLGIGFPGGTYAERFYVADVEATGGPAPNELHVDLEDADFHLVFPLRGAGRLRLVGVVPRGPDGESLDWTADDLRARDVAQLQLDVTDVRWFSTYRVHHRVADRFRGGHAFLLGDAAHIHSPAGGQGMNTGIGDAVNLAWKLGEVFRGADPALLNTYEPERIAFARRLVATTDRAFTLATRRGRMARFVRTRVVPALAPRLLGLTRVQRFLFRTLSQIVVRYPDSPLSAGRAGPVRGGDRLPWAGPDVDNFAPLASLAWQAHAYGEPASGVAEACAELGLACHVFPWREEMGRAGLTRGAVYVVRPDGYVGLADPVGDPRAIRAYVEGSRRGPAAFSGGTRSV